jgi:hypothetical protein
VLIAGACGPAGGVSDAAVARARRHCRHQVNAVELGAAVDAFALRVRAGSRPAPQDSAALMSAMVEGHAAVLRAAVADEPTQPNERGQSMTIRGTR